MDTSARLRIDVWSDYVCPFCYLELPLLDRLEQEMDGRLQVVWRAYELRPEPRPTLDPDGDYLHTTWERSVYPMARERGMHLRLPPVQPRSRKAFEAVAHAQQQGRFGPMHAGLFRAFFEEGRDIGQAEVLCAIGQEAGLDPDLLGAALEDGRHLAGVLDDERLAQSLGVSGVPAKFLRRAGAGWQEALPLRGALPYDMIQAAVNRLLGSGAV